MKTLKSIILVLFVLLPLATFSQGFKDENAGLRYLMAMGYMPEFSAEELASLDSLNSLKEFEALNVNIKSKLGQKKFETVFRLMQNADECKHFSLLVDHEYSLHSFAPPFRVIKNFSNYLMAEAFDLIKRNEKVKAAKLIISCMNLGRNIASEGMMINSMPGISIQINFLWAIENLLAHPTDMEIRNILKTYFDRISKAPQSLSPSFKAEIIYSKNFLKDIQSKPEVLAYRMFYEENKAPDKTEKEKKCLSNKNEIKFALDTATIDTPDINKLEPAEKVLNYLVEKKHLTQIPVCPRGGKYSVVFEKNGFYDVHCTCGSSDLSGPSKKLTPEQIEKAKQYISSDKFKEDCRKIDEFCQEIDKIKGIDDDSLTLAKSISNRLRKTESPLIKMAILRPDVFIEEARDLKKILDRIRLILKK